MSVSKNHRAPGCDVSRGGVPSPPAPLPLAEEGRRNRIRAGQRRRRGAVAVVALVCVAVASVFMVVVVRRALGEWKMVRLEARQVQCRWLAESALDRAAARLASDPKYQGETWAVPADRLPGRDKAAVKIEVSTPPGKPLERLVRVRADWPQDDPLRARVSKQTTLEIPAAKGK